MCMHVVHTINPSALPTSDIAGGRYMFDCKLPFIVSPLVHSKTLMLYLKEIHCPGISTPPPGCRDKLSSTDISCIQQYNEEILAYIYTAIGKLWNYGILGCVI